MTEEQVSDIARDFAQDWSLRQDVAPILALDFSWPSVAILDPLTQHFRFREEWAPVDEQIAKGVSAYLGVMAANCWRAFGAKVELSDEPSRGIVIRAVEGPKIASGESYTLFIESELRNIFKRPQSPFRVLTDFKRPVTPDQNLVSLFAIGLFTGLSPYGQGPWTNENITSFAPHAEHAVKILAKSCADHYHRLYPDEGLGRVAELYLHQLVFPPALVDEDLPGMAGARGVLDFASMYGLGAKDLLAFGEKIALSPDEMISGVGLIIVSALTPSLPGMEVLAAAQTRGMFTGLLRTGMLFMRDQLKLREDWMLQEKLLEEDLVRFEIESTMMMLPWVKIPGARAKDRNVAALIAALSVFDLENAIKFADTIIAETPSDTDVRLQRVYLDVIRGDLDRAEQGFRSLATEPGAEMNARLFNLWGLADIARGAIAEGLQHMEMAHRMMDFSEFLERSIPNDYGWALILNDRFEQALDVLEYAEKRSACPVTILLNKAFCCSVLNRFEEAEEIQTRLLKISPLDYRVFSNSLTAQITDLGR